MDSANSLRRLNKLWKDRHTHDDDPPSLEDRIIRIETGVDGVVSQTGAHIHLLADEQTVDDEAVEWASTLKTPLAIPVPDFPSTEVTINEPGYYNFHVDIEWSDHHGGGDVWLTRTRGELTETVWPPFGTTGLWSSPGGSRFSDVAPAIECQAGDVFEVWVDTGGSETVSQAVLVPYLVDRSRYTAAAPSGEPDMEFEYHAISIGATTSYDVPLPESQAGDLLVMIVGSNNTPSVSGWTQLVTKATSGSQATVLWKVATGSEGTEATVTFGSSTGIEMASFRFRLTGVNWASQPPSAAIDYGNTSPVDFPTAGPSHGPASYWVLPFCAHTFTVTPTSTPDGYPEILNATDVLSTGKLWVGAAFEGVAGSFSVGQIGLAGSGNAHTGVLFVKGV